MQLIHKLLLFGLYAFIEHMIVNDPKRESEIIKAEMLAHRDKFVRGPVEPFDALAVPTHGRAS